MAACRPAPAAVVSSQSAPEPALKPGVLAGPLMVKPPRQATQIALRDQDGKLFKLSSLRGKAVYLTFVYSHCPDVCPLMLQALGAAKRKLANPESMQIIAVSVDPKGDTPRAVKSFLRARQLTGEVRWLLGTRAQLRRVWHGVQHPRQVGARDARHHRARLADLRHRRPRPHPRRLSGLAAQVDVVRARRSHPRAREVIEL